LTAGEGKGSNHWECIDATGLSAVEERSRVPIIRSDEERKSN